MECILCLPHSQCLSLVSYGRCFSVRPFIDVDGGEVLNIGSVGEHGAYLPVFILSLTQA
jgi:hypothetical protein